MTMTRYEIERELDELYGDLNLAYNGDERTVCLTFNVDTRAEAIQMTVDEIDIRERWLAELDGEEEQYDVYDDHGFANAADYAAWRYGA